MTTPTTVNVQFQLRADTAANWTAANPILLANEFALETDTKKLKVGDGTTAWASLAYFPSIVTGGTVLGNLEIGSTGTLTFEGSTADGFETTLAVTDPTADRTITLPDQSGTVVVSGNASIVNADIAAGAEIAVSKLANGTANQVLVTDGTDVSWSDNLTLAGDLTVNGTTTTINTQDLLVEDKNIIIGNVDTPTDLTADGGGITLKGATDKTINWVDSTDAWTSSEHIELASGKSYRINGAEVLNATTLGSGVTSSSLTSVGTITAGTWQGTAIDATYLDSTVVTTGDTGTVTSTMIADGTIVDADVSSIAAIAGSKIDPDFGSQTVTTTGVISAAAGAAATPSIAFTGDLNTGLYSPGADQVAISTSGTPRVQFGTSEVVFNDNGNNYDFRIEGDTVSSLFFVDASADAVGIGTSNPDANLEVVGTDLVSTYQTLVSADSPTAVIVNQATDTYFRIAGGNYATASSVNLDLAPNRAKNKGTQGGWRFSAITGSTASSGAGSNLEIKPITYTSSDTITEGSASLAITNAGAVGIGTTSPNVAVEIGNATGVAQVDANALRINRGVTGQYAVYSSASGHAYIQSFNGNGGTISFHGDSNERARIDSSGRLLVGTSSDTGGYLAQVDSSSFTVASFTRYSSDGATVRIGAARGTQGSKTTLNNGDQGGNLRFDGYTGTAFSPLASIAAFCDGQAPATGDSPGRLVFSTTLNGAASPTEQLRITNDGVRGYNQAAPVAVDATATLTVANLKNGIITSTTAAAVTGTLPTGTLTEGGFSGLYTNFTFEWTVINTGATNNFTVAAGTAHTVVGNMVVAAGNSGRFATRRTGANTFVTYRLSS